jgi:hypothetical protein
VVRRVSDKEIRLFSQIHVFLKPGDLLKDKIEADFYERMWAMARADSFEPSCAW